MGNAIYAASQWGQLVVLAKLGSPETVGQFALALAVCAPVIMFANLQLRSVQATDARSEHKFADYFGLRLMTTGSAYLVIVAIVILSDYQQQTSIVILLIGLSKCFEALSDVIFGLLQQQERMDRIAKSLMIEGPLTLVMMAVVMYLTHNIVWATASLAIVWGLQLAFYDIPSALLILRAQSPGNEWQLLQPRFEFKLLRPLIWLALPLGFVALLISLNNNVPRYIVERYLGKDKLGIFAALSYVILAGNIVISALGQSASPRLAQFYAKKDFKSYRSLILKLLGIALFWGGAGVLFSIIFGQVFIRIVYSNEYSAYTNVFVVLMIAAGFNYCASFLGYAITAARYFRVQMPIFLLIVGVTTLVASIFVPHIGIMGAALTILVAAVVQTFVSLGVVIHALRTHTKENM